MISIIEMRNFVIMVFVFSHYRLNVHIIINFQYLISNFFFLELCNAATKIQASFRGHMSRKEQGGSSVVKTAEEMAKEAIDNIEEKVNK